MINYANRPTSQSAMEFLLTYSWAILIIAMVVYALFALGVFTRVTPSMACLANPMFLCTNETFTSSGAFAVTMGYTAGYGPITLTGLACNVTAGVPVTTPSVETTYVPLQEGQTVRLVFQCPLSRQLAIGQGTSINLWFYYNTETTNGLEQQYSRGVAVVNYESILWNVSEWTPSSDQVDLLPYSDLTANPASPTGITYVDNSAWSSSTGSDGGMVWAYGTDYHDHDIYDGVGTTLFPLPQLAADDAPCSGPPYASHGYTAIAHANMSGTYNVIVITDDGTQIFYRPVSGGSWTAVLSSNAWVGQAPTQYNGIISVSKGEYELAVDYTDICDPAGLSVVEITPSPTPIP
ncbi:MAG TPA: hypothetical protein VL944_01835 [Candidatus Acidoferrum sp.]|nr:hypothetical protein [Candidatus Acidoferrum sp.]